MSFSNRVCSHECGGSGPTCLSSWTTVFAVFTDLENGRKILLEEANGRLSTRRTCPLVSLPFQHSAERSSLMQSERRMRAWQLNVQGSALARRGASSVKQVCASGTFGVKPLPSFAVNLAQGPAPTL